MMPKMKDSTKNVVDKAMEVAGFLNGYLAQTRSHEDAAYEAVEQLALAIEKLQEEDK